MHHLHTNKMRSKSVYLYYVTRRHRKRSDEERSSIIKWMIIITMSSFQFWNRTYTICYCYFSVVCFVVFYFLVHFCLSGAAQFQIIIINWPWSKDKICSKLASSIDFIAIIYFSYWNCVQPTMLSPTDYCIINTNEQTNNNPQSINTLNRIISIKKLFIHSNTKSIYIFIYINKSRQRFCLNRIQAMQKTRNKKIIIR